MAIKLQPFAAVVTAVIIIFSTDVTGKPHRFSKTVSSTTLNLKQTKLTHLHFFFHDIVSGKNTTAVRVAESPTTNKSATGFGFLNMVDDPLTAEPELSSEIVGRAQGMYGSASKNELSLLLVINFVFMKGEFNGSSLSLLGRNAVFSGVREMPIVGGTGVFRFGRGYAQARTHTFNREEAVVEYNVFVFH